jgi:multisubunit Na+/H+ antiporter MnhB subunit
MTPTLWLVLDITLAGSVVALGWAALAARDAFAMIVLFIVFGLLCALAWVRLAAPDVALAEAAVGAGITGALMLKTWAHVRRRPARAPEPAPEPAPGRPARYGVGALVGLVAAACIAALALAPSAPGLVAATQANLAASGVENPVTAVLLNYRSLDTLLEVVVLFAAIVCVWLVERAAAAAPRPAAPGPAAPALGPVFLGFARLALPVAVLVGAYLLWLGADAPGGAFQGGAVLAAVGIVLVLGRLWVPRTSVLPWARAAFVIGTATFTGAAVAAAALGGAFLEYPAGQAKAWILVIEGVLTVSIAATLAALFIGPAPREETP